MNNFKYAMVIQWSEEDQCFLVGFPDFPNQKWRSHGDTYQDAVINGLEALESLIDLLRNCKNYFLLSKKSEAETRFLNINYS